MDNAAGTLTLITPRLGEAGQKVAIMDKNIFDQIEFDVLKCSKDGGYFRGHEHVARAIHLMSIGILENSPQDKWSYSGWKLTELGELYYEGFMKKVQEKHGHVWMTHKESNPDLYNDDSEYSNSVDIFAYEVGFHNGMKCKKCGYEFCMHCTSEFEVEKCTK